MSKHHAMWSDRAVEPNLCSFYTLTTDWGRKSTSPFGRFTFWERAPSADFGPHIRSLRPWKIPAPGGIPSCSQSYVSLTTKGPKCCSLLL